MKKLLALILLVCLCLSVLASCNPASVTEETEPATEVVTEAATEAATEPATEAATEPVEPEVELPETNLYLVGGSTVCEFPYDVSYFPRYGVGTVLHTYMNEKVTIKNMAEQGLTTKSYSKGDNYNSLKEELGEGDYLLITFGHNEFMSAEKDYTESSSFANNLYENYVQLAREVGATPILCTPIVRLAEDNDYSGKAAHITSSGDYRQAILDLGAAVGVEVVDLTAVTKERYETIGYEEAVKFHAADDGKYAEDGVTIVTDMDTVDDTCLNFYGAKYTAYQLACELQKIKGIGDYVKKDISEPVVDTFVSNPYYDIEDDSDEDVLTNVYLVGDSTVCKHLKRDFFYEQYGYGTQLGNYLIENVAVHNLAVSGSSSKDFTTMSQYETLKSGLKAGDYLIIGFGHNDEKIEDPSRFTDGSKDYTDPTSFGYSLYEYYIKLAREVGATPILCTPIVRVSKTNDYTGQQGHITPNGDYRQAILDLGEAVNVPVVDLTAITRARYEELGFEEAVQYHAVRGAKYAEDGVTLVPDIIGRLDSTHLGIFGAQYVAYRLACELQNIEGISDYIQKDLVEPTADVIVPYPYYLMED